MKDKSRNRTWGRVLTPHPIIILFQTTADSSDLITWRTGAATQTKKKRRGICVHSHEENDTFAQADSITCNCAPKNEMVYTSASGTAGKKTSPPDSDVKWKEATLWVLDEADVAPGNISCISPLPVYSTRFFSYCVSLRLPVLHLTLSYFIQKINHNPPLEGSSIKKSRWRFKSDILTLRGLFPGYVLEVSTNAHFLFF